MIKLIVSDMDGTLLDEFGNIPEEFWEVAEELKKENIIFAVASGRQYYTLLKQFEKIKDDIIFIAENGTYVMYHDKELFLNPLPSDDAKFVLKKIEDIKNTQVVFCGKKSAYIKKGDLLFEKEVRKYYIKLETVNNLSEVKDDICKIALCNFEGSEKFIYPYVKHLENRYKVVVSGDIWLDIEKLDANKGSALSIIQKKLGISYNESMAFGDYLNDIELMPLCKYSFAMENAHEDLKKICKFRAKSNMDNGVIEIIKKFCLEYN
ncbi:MAG: Cof-type HAD-IIB family hydrolase [Fusobacteriaceae bacterium]|jgi:Cof subfamily protein (haloacid dehalogenase superfamily)|nr:Cof-type HAD-IIB family hydrolase [Fusobacteriaceae bacterium]